MSVWCSFDIVSYMLLLLLHTIHVLDHLDPWYFKGSFFFDLSCLAIFTIFSTINFFNKYISPQTNSHRRVMTNLILGFPEILTAVHEILLDWSHLVYLVNKNCTWLSLCIFVKVSKKGFDNLYWNFWKYN